MRKRHLLFFLGACMFPLTGCFATDANSGVSMQGCSILGADDVEVWINGMPGPSGPTMIITFTADAPTPGYMFEGQVAAVKEMDPPSYVIDVIATPPEGIVPQVVTPTDVRFDIRVQQSEASTVKIRCGDTTLFEVDKVPTAY